MKHKCLNCDNTLEEKGGLFPPESQGWRRIRVPTRNFIYWFCSEECQTNYFQSHPTFLSRQERRWLVKHGYNLSSLKGGTTPDEGRDIQGSSETVGDSRPSGSSDGGDGGVNEGTM